MCNKQKAGFFGSDKNCISCYGTKQEFFDQGSRDVSSLTRLKDKLYFRGQCVQAGAGGNYSQGKRLSQTNKNLGTMWYFHEDSHCPQKVSKHFMNCIILDFAHCVLFSVLEKDLLLCCIMNATRPCKCYIYSHQSVYHSVLNYCYLLFSAICIMLLLLILICIF